ncbi:Peptidase M3A/M3B [Aphelenchoides avenae]|nr:Peptidase M3A/M3B [Aphelenchus avenae]
MEPLVVEEHDVDYAFSTLMLKMLTDWPVHDRSAAQYDLVQIDKLYARINLEKYQSKGIRDALKSIYESGGEGLNRWQMRFIELYLLEVRATGLDKDEEKTRDLIASWNRFVQEYRIKYLSNIMLTSGNHVFNIPSPSSLKDAPPQALLDLAAPSTANSSSSSQQASSKPSSTKTNKIEQNDFERGIVKMDNNDLLAGSAWRATMRASSIYNVLTYCSDRSVRAAAWDRFISRASFEHDWHNNSINIEEIRHNNEGLAKTLGYASTSEHRMANKMAGSPETVRNFLNALTQRVRPVFMDRMESWESYAAAKESITGGLQPFDLFYVSRREAEAHYEVNSMDLMNHFPFWKTFENLTTILEHLLNLRFKASEHLGRLYIDPFARATKNTVNWNTMLARPANPKRNLDKIIYTIGVACGPQSGRDILLHHTQLMQMLFHVGRAAQHLLSRSPYGILSIPRSPMYAADWDAADLLPTFLQAFVYKPNLLAALSSPHARSQQMLTDEHANNVALALSRATLWDTYRSLFWADYDLSIFEMEDRKKKFWLDLYRELFKEYFPFRMERNNYQPCSFTPIFNTPANLSMYYRKLWAEMLALDVHETFDRENDERATGERFKTTMLNFGAGETQAELYRRFQGREPSVGAICDFYDPPAEIDEERLNVSARMVAD